MQAKVYFDAITSCKYKMAMILVMLLCLFSMPVLSSTEDNEVSILNNRPIIGILSQELSASWSDFKYYKSYISASYVKFIEGAGARVVPVWINQTRSYYESLMNQINGVLFPGGSTSFNTKFGFADAGAIIYDIAKDLNSKGDYFPLWGTCQGFELLAYLGANRTNPLTDCSSGNVNLPLNFLSDYKISKLFGSAPDEIIQILANKPVTPNFHRFCLTQANVSRFMGDVNWRILSLNKDSNGLTFVSSMESRNFPAYGVQFHPEKNIFEWLPAQKTAHTVSAIKTAQYFANFLVKEARKSGHSFSTEEDEKKSLIYNFPTTYTGFMKKAYNEQLYLFKW